MALLLIPILGMVAFAVDAGWMVLAQSDLQNAADAAALAGAEQLLGQQQLNPATGKYSLVNGFAQYYLTGQVQQSQILAAATSAAKASAKDFASYHSAGGNQSLTLNDADIQLGFTDANGGYTPLPPYPGFPNTVKVTLRLDNQANSPLKLFFGPVLGTKTVNLTANASAAIYAGTINSFNPSSSFVSRILPMTYDINHWNNFLQTGLGPDGTLSLDTNGVPQLQAYPSIKFVGNFGMLSLDQLTDGASTISSWIDSGVPASTLQQELNDNLLPLSAHNPNAWDWKGNPGLKTSDIHAVMPVVGDTYLLPLFKPVDPGFPNPATYQAGVNQGTTYAYNIVQFIGIRITYVDNSSVMVQPAAVVDPNPIFTGVVPVQPPTTGSSNLQTTYLPPKITQ
jgi:Flp pilus assembly protein TadG